MKKDFYKQEITLNILLISTDKFILDIFEKVFRKYGHKTTSILTPLTAIELIKEKEQSEPFDILFIDYDKYTDINRDQFNQIVNSINHRIIISELGSAFIYKIKKVLDDHTK